MKYIAVCAKGLEDVTQQEIKELLKASSHILIPGRVLFSARSVKKLLEKSQSVMKVYELKQQCHSLDEIKPFTVKSPFRVVCSRKGAYALTSQEVEQTVGGLFYKKGAKVNLEEPKTVVLVDIVDDDILVGVDLTPVPLSKREDGGK